jgi:adenosylhomocysteine nucleosidase
VWRKRKPHERHTVELERYARGNIYRTLSALPRGRDAVAVRASRRRAQIAEAHPASVAPMLPYSVVALVGLAFEARIAAGPGVLVICRGPDIAETLRLAYDAGCRSIISFGVAGGLAPDLRPGDWIVASAVLDAETTRPTHPVWSRNLLEIIPEVRYGPVIGVRAPVADPLAKHDLHARTGAIAVDMESHIVAEFAAAHGMSFAVARVIVDPAHRRVPDAALIALRPDGGSNVSAILREVLTKPAQVLPLLRIAGDAYAARSALLRLRRLLGPGFGISEADETADNRAIRLPFLSRLALRS